MKSAPRHTPDTVMVFPIDMQRLDTDINRFCHEGFTLNHPEGKPLVPIQRQSESDNKTYATGGTLALMKEPKVCIIDDEFVGHLVTDKATFYVFETEIHTDGHESHCVFPTREVTLTLPELAEYLKPGV